MSLSDFDQRAKIERANLRWILEHPEEIESLNLKPRDFSVPELREAYETVLRAVAGRWTHELDLDGMRAMVEGTGA